MADNSTQKTKSTIPYWVAIVFLVIGAFSWAGSSVAGRMASGNVPPFSLSFIRWFCVALLFLAIGGKETWKQRHLVARHWKLLVAFGFFGVVGFTVPYYVGLQFTVAVNTSLMNASGTLWAYGVASRKPTAGPRDDQKDSPSSQRSRAKPRSGATNEFTGGGFTAAGSTGSHPQKSDG